MRKKQAEGGRDGSARGGEQTSKVKQPGEALYRELVEGADDVIVRVDAGGRLIYVNRAAGEVLGLSPADCVGHPFADFIHPDDVPGTAEAYARMKGDATAGVMLENRIVGRDGDVHHISWTVNIHRDREGHTAGINAIGKDVTGLRRAGEALHTSERDFHTLVAASADGTIVLDGDGLVRYVNAATEALFGMPAAEMTGQNFGFPTLIGEPVDMYILREFRKFVAVEMRVSEVQWEGKPSYLITFRDLTDRIVAEQATREARDRLEAEVSERTAELTALEKRSSDLIKRAPTGIYEIDFRGPRFVSVNDYVCEASGYTREELLRMDPFDLLDDASQAVFRDRIRRQLAGEKVGDTVEYRGRAKDGRELCWILRVTFTYANGEPVGAIVTCHDVTDRRRAEEALRGHQANLEKAQRVAHLGFWEWDVPGERMHWSDEVYRICGYDPDGARPTPEMFVSMIHPADVSRAIGDLKRAMLGEIPLVAEYQIACPDGTARHVRFEFSEAVFDPKGNAVKLFGIIQDVTERKRAEEALKLTDYSLDNVRDNVIWFCPDGRINYANNAACRQFGYSRDEMLALTIFDINPTYDRESWNDRWSELKSKGAVQIEVENRARDGRWFPLEVTNTYIKYGDREFMFGYGRDITRRRRAEESLRESEAKFKALAETAPAAILVYQDERYVYVNPAAEQVTGFRADELLSMKFWEIMHPDDRAMVRERGKARLRGEAVPSRYEVRHRTKDGRDGVLEVYASTMNYDGRRAGLITALDVTDRKRAEEALRVSEEKYREIVESSNSIILRVDRDAHITFMNEFALRFFGFDREEVLGRNVVGTIVPATDAAGRDLTAMAEDIVRHPEDYKTNTHQNMRKNGELVWISWTNKAIRDGEGNLVEIHSVGNDVTALKQAEDELKAANLQAELYLDLMGHDINNMHQVALGYLELAEEMGGDETMKEFLERPRDVLLRSARLIDNVRKLQKLREGAYRSGPVELAGALADVMKEYDEVPGKVLKLDTHGIADGYVQANELLYDVFSNLVSNAIKHSGAHAEVTVDLARVRENGDTCYRVSVEDNGPGVADSFKHKVFNRLLKGDTTAKGMGLGLYIVKTLVDSYRGRVWVEDRVPGDHTKGAKFVVLLPALDKKDCPS